jgi:hypothetical protein
MPQMEKSETDMNGRYAMTEGVRPRLFVNNYDSVGVQITMQPV